MDVISPWKALYNPTPSTSSMKLAVRTFFSLFPFNSLIMMEYYFQRQYYFFLFFFLLCSGFLSSSSSFPPPFKLEAGGKHGWVLKNTSDKYNYSRWAGEYRFRINDIIGNYFSVNFFLSYVFDLGIFGRFIYVVAGGVFVCLFCSFQLSETVGFCVGGEEQK
jgi:hypothetical protein